MECGWMIDSNPITLMPISEKHTNLTDAIPDPKDWITSLNRLMNIGPESKLKEQHYRDYLWMLAILKHTSENGDLLWHNRCRLNDISDASGWLIADTLNKINRYSKD
jgi:hypothetical protein